MREPYPDRSFGILLRFSMPRSPIRFLSCPMRALTYPCRSFAYLYSAFSERSPCARALAISLGRSMFSSCSSWSISPCKRCLIFASGSDMVVGHQKVVAKKMFAESGLAGWLAGPRANHHYRCAAFPPTRGRPRKLVACRPPPVLGHQLHYPSSAHSHVNILRLRVAPYIFDRQRVGR